MRKMWVACQEIKNGRKHKKGKKNQMIHRKKKIRRDQLRLWLGKDVNFVDEFTSQESVLHMDRNA